MPELSRKAFVRYWLPAIGWMLVIAIESMFLSAARTGSFIDPILHAIFPRFSMEQIEHLHEFGRKTGHFIGYGLMSFFLFRAFRGTHHIHEGTEQVLRHKIAPAGRRLFEYFWQWRWAAYAILGTALIASADEIHQMSDPTRTGTWWDVLLDSVGALTFQLLLMAILRARTPQPPPATPETVTS